LIATTNRNDVVIQYVEVINRISDKNKIKGYTFKDKEKRLLFKLYEWLDNEF
jgi:hypothetical protein